ncbi:hypothetical protein [Streptomyces sp. JNUCC 63]
MGRQDLDDPEFRAIRTEALEEITEAGREDRRTATGAGAGG